MDFTYCFGLLIPKCHKVSTGIRLGIKKTSEICGYIKQNLISTAQIWKNLLIYFIVMFSLQIKAKVRNIVFS